jgi:hypothetical protein
MRDSNPRGVAPNTLSKSGSVRSARFAGLPDAASDPGMDPADGRRTALNETTTETAAQRPKLGTCGAG